MDRQLRKLVVVGDGAVGKTCLLIALERGQFPSDYVPTVFDSPTIDIEVKGECIKFTLCNISGQGDYGDRLRPLSYPVNVLEKWDPEIMHFGAGRVPCFLVGCKKDSRHDPAMLSYLARGSQVPVTTEQGRDMAKVIGAEYFECSSKTGEGVRELFARVTESMEAEKVVRVEDIRPSYHRPWYRGCIVV